MIHRGLVISAFNNTRGVNEKYPLLFPLLLLLFHHAEESSWAFLCVGWALNGGIYDNSKSGGARRGNWECICSQQRARCLPDGFIRAKRGKCMKRKSVINGTVLRAAFTSSECEIHQSYHGKVGWLELKINQYREKRLKYIPSICNIFVLNII